jgi:hypothetical protein
MEVWGHVIDDNVVHESAVGIGETVLFCPIDIFPLGGGFGVGKVEIGDFEPLAITLDAHVVAGYVQIQVERVQILHCELPGACGREESGG